MNKEKKNPRHSCNISRREFLGVSALALGSIQNMSVDLPIFSASTEPLSAFNTKLNVKFIYTGYVHEEAFEGPCRWGDLKNLTHEVESNRLDSGFKDFKKDLELQKVPPEINLLEPSLIYGFIAKGNPEIVVSNELLEGLKDDDKKTDLYIVTHAFEGYKIAERYNKPIIVMHNAGRAADMCAALRAKGLKSFHAFNLEEAFNLARLFFVKKALANTKVLCLTNFPEKVPAGVVSTIIDLDSIKQQYGMGYEYVDYKKLFSTMDKLIKDNDINKKADEIASHLLKNAQSSNMTQENVKNSVLFYLTIKHLMAEYSCNAFTVECFELCSSMEPWKRKFTPCLTHSLLKDRGFPTACERDINVLLTIALKMYLSNKAVYMGNFDVNRSENTINLHHSVASLKMHGYDTLPSDYKLKHFTQSGFGATFRYDFNQDKGKVVTIGRFGPYGKKILVTKGEIIGCKELFKGLGCAQSVDVKIANGREFWREDQNFGSHLSLVLGDYIEEIRDLGELMDFEVVYV